MQLYREGVEEVPQQGVKDGNISTRGWRYLGSISTRGCRGSICGESWRDHKCSAADTNALNDHPSQHLPMLMKLHLLCTIILLQQDCTIAQPTQKHLSHRHTNDGMEIVAKTGDYHPPAILTDPFSIQNINIVGSRNSIHCAEQEWDKSFCNFQLTPLILPSEQYLNSGEKKKHQ